jgi:hypothetical protein
MDSIPRVDYPVRNIELGLERQLAAARERGPVGRSRLESADPGVEVWIGVGASNPSGSSQIDLDPCFRRDDGIEQDGGIERHEGIESAEPHLVIPAHAGIQVVALGTRRDVMRKLLDPAFAGMTEWSGMTE